jgi:hypothetical protein
MRVFIWVVVNSKLLLREGEKLQSSALLNLGDITLKLVLT